MRVVHIHEELIQKLIEHSLKEAPKEACGILSGVVGEKHIHLERVYECENIHPKPTLEYFIKPEDQLRFFLEIEEDPNLDLVGFYHSHPRGPDSPSQIDASKNLWPNYPIAIISLDPAPRVTFWQWSEGSYRPMKVVRESF